MRSECVYSFSWNELLYKDKSIFVQISYKSNISTFLLIITNFYYNFLKIFYLFIFRKMGREKESERNIYVWEIHQLVVSLSPQTRDLVHIPGMCPDWESNWWPFGSQAGTQSNEPHQPWQVLLHFRPSKRFIFSQIYTFTHSIVLFWFAF